MGDFDFSGLFRDPNNPSMDVYADSPVFDFSSGVLGDDNSNFPGRPNTGSQINWDNAFKQSLSSNPLANRGSDFYFDPESPEYKNYISAASKAPESEGLISNYLNSRPNESDYSPSIWRRLGGFALGTLSGLKDPALAGKNAQTFVMDPYNNALTDWKAQGQDISARAKLLDAARNREVNALKFGLQNQTKASRYQSLDEGTAQRLASTFARGKVGTEQGQQRIDETAEKNQLGQNLAREKQDDLQNYRNQTLDMRQQLLDLREGLANAKGETGKKLTAHDQRAKDPTEILRQSNAAEELAKHDTAKDIQSNPAFSDIAQLMSGYQGDPFTEIDKVMSQGNISPERARLFKIWLGNTLKNNTAKYQGEE